MADNVVITAGSGTTVHADEYTHTTLGSGKTQLVKLVDGVLDSETPITVDVGAKANALRVAPANDITDATYIGDIKFGEALPAGTAAIGKLAANSGVDIGDVDILSIAAGDNNIGNVDIVTHPSDTFAADAQVYGKGVLCQGDDGTDRRAILVGTDGHVQVDIVGALPAGSAAIGKLVANDGVDIGDVDVTSVVSGTGATNLGKARDSALGATDTGVMALAVRDDTLTTLTPVDGDYVPLRVSSTGQLHVTGGGGGTQYNIDTVLGAAATTTLAGVVRDDSLTTLTEADGDVSVLRVSSTGQLHVTGGGGGTEYTEDVVTANPQVGTATMMERDDALTTVTPVEGDWIGLRGTAEGALWVQDFNSDAILVDTSAIKTAVEIIDNAISGSEMQVDVVAALPAGDNNIGNVDIVTLPASTNTIEVVGDAAENAVAAGNPVLIGGRYDATPRTLGDTDVGAIALDADGAVHITDGGNTITVDGTITANLSATDNAVLDQIELNTDPLLVVGGGAEATAIRVTLANDSTGVLSVDDNGGTLTVDGTVTASNTAGDIAHDSADSGNPVKVGGKAYNLDGTAPGTAVTEADRAQFITDVYGRQFVETVHPNLWDASDNQSTAQTNTALKAAPGAGLSLYITDIIVSNGATAGNIKFVEDTAGTPVDKVEVMYFAVNGGAVIPLRTPIKITANKDFGYTSVSVTTHSITVSGFIAP